MGELRERMTAREFYDWWRFAAYHPFPADLIDLHGARMAWMTASINRESSAPPYEFAQFRLLRDPTPPPPPVAARPGAMLEADRMLLALRGTQHGG